MQRIDPRDIACHVHVILTCMPKGARHAGGWSGEQAVHAATAKIMALFERAVILKPDEVLIHRGSDTSPIAHGPGEFGVTEPWPFEPGCRPPSVAKPPKPHEAA
jgi:hypothetical protein